jgi:hypothetical protein
MWHWARYCRLMQAATGALVIESEKENWCDMFEGKTKVSQSFEVEWLSIYWFVCSGWQVTTQIHSLIWSWMVIDLLIQMVSAFCRSKTEFLNISLLYIGIEWLLISLTATKIGTVELQPSISTILPRIRSVISHVECRDRANEDSIL